jgi:hypothetical protein
MGQKGTSRSYVVKGLFFTLKKPGVFSMAISPGLIGTIFAMYQ